LPYIYPIRGSLSSEISAFNLIGSLVPIYLYSSKG
jgi:hypothetical protein